MKTVKNSNIVKEINPFVTSLQIELLKVTVPSKKFVVTNENSAENITIAESNIEYNQSILVEKQKHTKIYHTSYDTQFFFKSLNECARSLYLYIVLNLSKNEDKINLEVKKICSAIDISKNTYYKAIKSLKEHNIICNKEKAVYWINPNYLFNGDRIKYMSNTKPENLKVVYQLDNFIKFES